MTVIVQKSKIHGNGLFTTKNIKKKTIICDFGGEIISVDTLEKRYPNDTLAEYTVRQDDHIQDAKYVEGFGRFVNGYDDINKCNARFELIDGNVKMVAHTFIAANQEILAFYGTNFFSNP